MPSLGRGPTPIAPQDLGSRDPGATPLLVETPDLPVNQVVNTLYTAQVLYGWSVKDEFKGIRELKSSNLSEPLPRIITLTHVVLYLPHLHIERYL